jgi:hypothetical protein
MNRRRLVDASRDWLEILNVEYPWIEISVPAYDVKWMVVEHMACEPVPNLNPDFIFTTVCMRFQINRHTYVAFTVGSVFEELAVTISVAFRGFYL